MESTSKLPNGDGHENIVGIIEFGEDKGTFFLAMELVEGIDLHEYIERKGTIDPEESRQIMIQATRALSHALKTIEYAAEFGDGASRAGN